MRARVGMAVAAVALVVAQTLGTAAFAGPSTLGGTAAARSRTAAVARPRTSCQSVVHIGDSTSVGLVSTEYLPNPADRMGAQYRDVGVRHVHLEIAGARSIVEVIPGSPNAYEVAKGLVDSGYRGCWVLALGTNDTANVAVGSNVGRAARIAKMMNLIGSKDPVMWVNVRSLLHSGPYSETDMELWDAALRKACASHPNLRIYNWAGAVRDSWFSSDGIHFTSYGFKQRAHAIADALADAFPYGSQTTGCVTQ
jgi:lysophospholipase L1-like esterase